MRVSTFISLKLKTWYASWDPIKVRLYSDMEKLRSDEAMNTNVPCGIPGIIFLSSCYNYLRLEISPN